MNNQNREQYGRFDEQEYETEGFEDQAYGDEAYAGAYDDGYAGDTADEDFPEPAAAAGNGKKKPSPLVMAAGGALAVCLIAGAGYYFMNPAEGEDGGGEMAFEMPDVMGMIGLGGGEEEAPVEETPAEPAAEGEAAPPPKPKPKPKLPVAKAEPNVAKPPAKPVPPKPAKPAEAAAPKLKAPAVAAKPAEKPAVKAPAPAKPKPVVAAAPAQPAAGAAPSSHTAITFANGSYWVPAAEMERLWSFSSALKTPTGQITIEARPGGEADAANLTRKRADRVAELIRKNNVGSRYEVNVKILGAASGTAGQRVDIYYAKPL